LEGAVLAGMGLERGEALVRARTGVSSSAGEAFPWASRGKMAISILRSSPRASGGPGGRER